MYKSHVPFDFWKSETFRSHPWIWISEMLEGIDRYSVWGNVLIAVPANMLLPPCTTTVGELWHAGNFSNSHTAFRTHSFGKRKDITEGGIVRVFAYVVMAKSVFFFLSKCFRFVAYYFRFNNGSQDLCGSNITLNNGLKLNSWRATALRSLAPNHTCLEVSGNHEELD